MSKVNLHIKGTAYMTLVRSVLLHGAAAWTTTTVDEQMLEAWDAANLRYILRVSRTQHIRTTEIRARLNVSTSVNQEVSKARLRMLMKVARAGRIGSLYDSVYLRKLIEANEGAKHIRKGRPMKSWLQCVKADLGTHHYGLASGMHLAREHATRYRQLFLD